MIVDSSAIVAIVCQEPDHERLIDKLAASPSTGIGTPTLTELGMVLASRLRNDPRGLIIRLLDEFDIAEVPFGEDHWREAVSAYLRFGRGRHPAKLNFGDCLSYSVSRLAGEPLLFVGDDFPQTDIQAA